MPIWRSSVGRASTWSHTVRQWHDRSGSQARSMPDCRYKEGNSSAVILVTKRLAGVAPQGNFKECVTCMPPPSANEVAHSGFETQKRHHQKSKTGVSVAPQKWPMSFKNFKKKGEQWLLDYARCYSSLPPTPFDQSYQNSSSGMTYTILAGLDLCQAKSHLLIHKPTFSSEYKVSEMQLVKTVHLFC